MKKTKKNNKGFSLVELIVVIAIMAVLIGILAPTLLKNIEKSRYSKDIQALDSIYTAVQQVLADEKASAYVVDRATAYTLTEFLALDGTGTDASLIDNAFYGTVDKSLTKTGDTSLASLVSKAFKTTTYAEVTILISGSGTDAVVTVTSDDTAYDKYSSK